jgi:hypothetical protein
MEGLRLWSSTLESTQSLFTSESNTSNMNHLRLLLPSTARFSALFECVASDVAMGYFRINTECRCRAHSHRSYSCAIGSISAKGSWIAKSNISLRRGTKDIGIRTESSRAANSISPLGSSRHRQINKCRHRKFLGVCLVIIVNRRRKIHFLAILTGASFPELPRVDICLLRRL